MGHHTTTELCPIALSLLFHIHPNISDFLLSQILFCFVCGCLQWWSFTFKELEIIEDNSSVDCGAEDRGGRCASSFSADCSLCKVEHRSAKNQVFLHQRTRLACRASGTNIAQKVDSAPEELITLPIFCFPPLASPACQVLGRKEVELCATWRLVMCVSACCVFFAVPARRVGFFPTVNSGHRTGTSSALHSG